MISAENTRLVVLDEDLCGCIYNALAQSYPSQIEKANEFHRAWKAAPADPAGVLVNVLCETYAAKQGEEFGDHLHAQMRAVLAALGVPDASQRPTDPV